MKKALLFLFLALLCQGPLWSQTNLAFITDVNIVPANPTPTDTVYITVIGELLDSCVVLNNFDHTNGLTTISLNMDFSIESDSFPGVECGAGVIPFDTTICIGVLPPTTYTIDFTGSNFTNIVDPASLTFVSNTNGCVDENGTIWVRATGDTGPGSLREAIECANMTPGPNLIRFYIPTTTPGEFRIGALSGAPLPVFTDPGTVIDGTTQPGWDENGSTAPIIVLNGELPIWTTPESGFDIQANDTEVYGITFKNMVNDGIKVSNASGVVIGAVGKGNEFYANGDDLDFFPDATGGPYDGAGVHLEAGTTNCLITGNWIGTDSNGSSGLGNELAGIYNNSGSNNCTISQNTIQENPIGGLVEGASTIAFSQNSFRCNAAGISLTDNGNGNISAPTIEVATIGSISGTISGSAGMVEIFINDATDCASAECQGTTYLGSANANVLGWTLTPPFANGIVLQGGERITATINSNNNQSSFATCKVVTGVSPCTDSEGIILVTNTDDEGAGSLREAINCANSTPGANTINFSTSGTIMVGSTSGAPLPTLTSDGTIINGQGGIILNGNGTSWNLPADGLTLAADLCEIYGLEIINFPDDGISLENAFGNTIGDIGLGNTIHSNGSVQDFWPGVPGGPYNGSGIHLAGNASNNTIFGNSIGTDAGGTLVGGNEFCGILLESNCSGNKLGSSTSGTGNIINNNATGIQIGSNGVENTLLQNSLTCNDQEGIVLASGANNDLSVPTFTEARTDSIWGAAPIPSGTVELYLLNNSNCQTAACQGSTRLGVQNFTNGTWLFTMPFEGGAMPTQGELVTAIITDADGNSSAYAICEPLLNPCFVQLEILSLTHASCGLPNGEVMVNGVNGTGPYIYNLGNGGTINPTFSDLSFGIYDITVTDFLGCSAEEQVFIMDTEAPDITLVANSSTTCDDSSGGLEYIATGGTPDYSYSLDGGPGQSTGLFQNLSAGSYEVIVTDDNGCTAADQQVVSNNGEFPIASFSFTTNFLTVTFTDESFFADNVSYDLGDGMGSPEANPVHTYAIPGTYTVCQMVSNSCGMDTTCQLVMVMAPADLMIAGSVIREDLAAINNVELFCINSDITDTNGNYVIEGLPNGLNCSVAPEKTDIPAAGVSITDVVLVQRHLVLLDTLDSPYKIIAADVNGSENVNISDIVLMQRVILLIDLEFPIGKTWRFIPEEYSFPDPLNPFDNPFPESISYNGITMDEFDQNYIGLKIGDVNNSGNTQNIQNDPILLSVRPSQQNDVLTLDFSFENDISLNGLQGKINFDPALLQIINIQENNLPNFNYNIQEATTSFLWHDEQPLVGGTLFSKNNSVFSISFTLNGPVEEALASLQIDVDRSLTFDLEEGEKKLVLNVEAIDQVNSTPAFASDQIILAPNPFRDQLWLTKDSQLSGTLNWELFNAQGLKVATGTTSHQSGQSVLLLDGKALPSGVYIININGEQKQFSQRILKF